MSHDRETHTESQVTADSETIRSWSETETLVPVRHEHEGEERLEIVPESETRSAHEELSWEEFEREMRDRNMIAVRRGGESGEIDVVERSEVIGRATVESEAVEEALVEGETVETEITERRVVEHVVVEEATVQSEIADREIIQSDIVDVDLLTTDVNQCSVTRAEPPDESTTDLTWFQPGTQLEDPYDVEIDVDEGWEVTREVVERLTIESQIVDTDVEETETVESDTMRETVDIEGVTETILEGELVESPETAQAAVEHGHVESQFREDDIIETNLLRRQTIEEEMSVSKEITGEVSNAETVSADAIAHTVVDSEIVEQEEYDVDLAATVAASETNETMTDETMAGETDEPMAAETDEPTTEATAGEGDVRMTPSEEDEGKTVVNPNGDEVGMVVDVEGGQMYVDPHPSITDRIRTVLGWSEHDDESYLLGTDHIDHIDDDQVVLSVEHAEE
ncbi:hypothetical protein NDI56_18080 [Haloarcula sp. S1CR25-12]|uniref:DUF2382 domain-containing protein n=1 Tax=Haloarcula saliterrae TaxID=2950534 RepID=A0ABU2FGC4_9EURY|nr:hypothetical protein [Haloarcula sp. S1CR25-12]MDS0261312.1 hypothetical protein [Haloarcula sp. S1CR25-12]